MIASFISTLGLFTIVVAAPTYPNETSFMDCSKTESIIISFAHPSNCSKYFQCNNGTKIEMTCPGDQQYNAALKTCDNPKYAGCKLNASTPPSNSIPPLLHVTIKPIDSNQTQSPILNPTPTYTRNATVSVESENTTGRIISSAPNSNSNALQRVVASTPKPTSTISDFTTKRSVDVSTSASSYVNTSTTNNGLVTKSNETIAVKQSNKSTPSKVVEGLDKGNVESAQSIKVGDKKNNENNNSEEDNDETESEDTEDSDKSGKSATTTS
ncbi:hypothetical protein Trydic_g16574 [Trypoxylus dichotomus]